SWDEFPHAGFHASFPAHSGNATRVESGPLATPAADDVPAVPQAVVQPLTRAAIFQIVTLNGGAAGREAVRSLCAELAALLRAVGFRGLHGNPACLVGLGVPGGGAGWWARRGRAGLHPSRKTKAGPRHAVSTPGDLIFHIRAKRMDLCFELATQMMARLKDAVSPVHEVHGFKYFDDRD